MLSTNSVCIIRGVQWLNLYPAVYDVLRQIETDLNIEAVDKVDVLESWSWGTLKPIFVACTLWHFLPWTWNAKEKFGWNQAEMEIRTKQQGYNLPPATTICIAVVLFVFNVCTRLELQLVTRLAIAWIHAQLQQIDAVEDIKATNSSFIFCRFNYLFLTFVSLLWGPVVLKWTVLCWLH